MTHSMYRASKKDQLADKILDTARWILDSYEGTERWESFENERSSGSFTAFVGTPRYIEGSVVCQKREATTPNGSQQNEYVLVQCSDGDSKGMYNTALENNLQYNADGVIRGIEMYQDTLSRRPNDVVVKLYVDHKTHGGVEFTVQSWNHQISRAFQKVAPTKGYPYTRVPIELSEGEIGRILYDIHELAYEGLKKELDRKLWFSDKKKSSESLVKKVDNNDE